MRDFAYLKLLSREYPTIKAASSEIINLTAIRGLPKGTEYFFSDLHGEHEAFIHLLKSSSGIIREKIKKTFGCIIPAEEQAELANLIYYPELVLGRRTDIAGAPDDWKRINIYRLVQICKAVSSKYTRSKVRKKLPPEFAYIIDELIHVDYNADNKGIYYSEIIRSILDIDVADKFIIALCELIQNLTIDSLHIIGDIFDRGPRADLIMNELMQFHDVDVQWGNHDISWMGAATGNPACICNVLRIAISYNSFDVLEDGYGINLRPLSMFAAGTYLKDNCARFVPHILDQNLYDAVDPGLAAKMHKAITVIQLKVEGQIIKRHPEYQMKDRLLLGNVNQEKGTVRIGDQEYPMEDMEFPTIDWADPYRLTPQEEELLHTLERSFCHSDLLHQHVKFLYSHGSLYKSYNKNLLYHGCIPMRQDGSFDSMVFDGKVYAGKELMDYVDQKIQNAYFLKEESKEKKDARDFMWYLWCGAKSPVYGKDKMTTFEHYFVKDSSTYQETMNPYYQLSVKEEYCDKILAEFDLPAKGSHIINGHVPVKIKDGETPIKGGGKLYIIDGGLSKAYQSKTGIAGYTLIYNSNHLALAEHMPFVPGMENTPKVTIVEKMKTRVMVGDTDLGKELEERTDDLKELVAAYRNGILKETINHL